MAIAGGPGLSPGGAPGGNPMIQQALSRLAGQAQGPGGDPTAGLRSMQAAPPPSGEEQALRSALQAINFAVTRLIQRSPELAQKAAQAAHQVKLVLEKLPSLGDMGAPVAGPPPGMPAGGGLIGDMSGAPSI